MATRIGAQTPRIEVRPSGGVSDSAREVSAIGLLAGVDLRKWQRHIAAAVTERRADGKFTSFEVGFEVTRQNGKTALVEVLILWHLLVNPDTREIVYSAHEFKTARKTFRRMERMIRNSPTLFAQVGDDGFRYGNDDQYIQTLDGSVVRFMARSGNAGRGFTGDLIILDEAFNLDAEMIAAIVSTLTTSRNPQIIYLSSAGKLTSEYLNGLRARALGEDPGRLTWMEWSAPAGTHPEDPEGWYVSNPMLGILFDEEYILDELRTYRNDPQRGETAWLRERLGIRESVTGETVLDLKAWAALADPTAQPGEVLSLAVDMPPSRDVATIGAASYRPDGGIHLEVVDRRAGTGWVTEELVRLKETWGPVAIVVDASSAAGSLLPDLRVARLKTRQINLREYAAACGQIHDMINRPGAGPSAASRGMLPPTTGLVHIGQEELTNAVDAARKRMLAGESAWVWSRKNALADISPLVAVTHALIGLRARAAPQSTRKKARRIHVG